MLFARFLSFLRTMKIISCLIIFFAAKVVHFKWAVTIVAKLQTK